MSPQADRAPAFQFYPKDWDSDSNVIPMSYEEEGVYFALCRRYWLDGTLPHDLERLRKLLKGRPSLAKMQKWWDAIGPCFQVDGNSLTHKRLDRERESQRAYREAKARAGSIGGRSRSAQAEGKQNEALLDSASSKNEAKPSSSSSSSSPSSSAPSVKTFRRSASASVTAPGFMEFWIAYPKHKSRADAEKAWTKLGPDAELQKQILAALAWQVKSPDWLKDNGQFVPLPASWLRARRWEDEPVRSSPFGSSSRTAGNLAQLQDFVAGGRQ